jgi:hypothetical protein
MTNHKTPQLSRMDLANHCATFPGLSLLSTQVVKAEYEACVYEYTCRDFIRAKLLNGAVSEFHSVRLRWTAIKNNAITFLNGDSAFHPHVANSLGAILCEPRTLSSVNAT